MSRHIVVGLAVLLLAGAGLPAAAQTLRAKDIVSLESAGTMRDISAGAYEKTLWHDIKRSLLTDMLKAIPPESPLRTIHDMKRRALLSYTDASLIDNDVPPTTDDNLFILRILKLQQMGLFEDALKLYTDNIDIPRDARLAQTGLTLIIHQRGLATACLEEKVLAPQFPDDGFFDVLDSICSYTLGQTDEPPSLDSIILKAVLKEDSFKVKADDLSTFTQLSPLELAILKSEGRIDYGAFDTSDASLSGYPSAILMTFLKDQTLPADSRQSLQMEMARRGYLSVRALPAWKEAHIVKVDVEDKRRHEDEAGAQTLFWSRFQPLLTRETDIVALTPYGAVLSTMEPRTDGADFYKSTAVILASGQNLPRSWCEKLRAQPAPYGPLFYETLILLRSCERDADKAVDNLETSLQDIDIRKSQELFIIMGLLSQNTEDHARLKAIYEKDLPLTSDFDYVMHADEPAPGMSEIQGSGERGAYLLGGLIAVKGKTGENINPAVLQITVKSLLDGGFDADARQLAKEVLVGMLLKQK
jgi:hypothetical protein